MADSVPSVVPARVFLADHHGKLSSYKDGSPKQTVRNGLQYRALPSASAECGGCWLDQGMKS